MITSELPASHECLIYEQSVKYLNQICLPELIHLKKINVLLKCQRLCHVTLPTLVKTRYYQRNLLTIPGICNEQTSFGLLILYLM